MLTVYLEQADVYHPKALHTLKHCSSIIFVMYTHTTSQGSQVKENLSLKHTYIETHTPYSRKFGWEKVWQIYSFQAFGKKQFN